jgi:3-hydroxyacyl-[acyl-carrier-protein] dehydratase
MSTGARQFEKETMAEVANEILDAIPHRPPMLLVDELVERSDVAIHCRKTFHADEHFVQGHYPGNAIVPGVILCECGMQTGAILLSALVAADATKVPVATRMNDVKFKRVVRPGDTVDIEVDLVEKMGDAFFLKAKVSCAGKVAARFEFACAMAAVEPANS